MSPITKRHLELAEEIDSKVKDHFSRGRNKASSPHKVANANNSNKNHLDLLVPPQIDAQDWGALIDRVRAAAHHARAVEVQARMQEQGVEALRERVRADFKLASERVREAEDRAAKAEARAAAAEERARVAENYLQSVHDTLASEFSTARL